MLASMKCELPCLLPPHLQLWSSIRLLHRKSRLSCRANTPVIPGQYSQRVRLTHENGILKFNLHTLSGLTCAARSSVIIETDCSVSITVSTCFWIFTCHMWWSLLVLLCQPYMLHMPCVFGLLWDEGHVQRGLYLSELFGCGCSSIFTLFPLDSEAHFRGRHVTLTVLLPGYLLK